MAELFNVIFAGEISGRADPALVRANVGKLFNASDAVLDKLFSGQPVAIKKMVDRATAMQLRARMKQAGAETRIVQVDEQGRPLAPATPTAPAPAPAAPVPSAAPAAATAAPSPAGSMAARLQQMAREQAQAAPATPGAGAAASGNWDIKPVGTRLSDPLPPPPPAPDVSGISLAAANGNLVSPQELPRPAPVQVDISGLSMAAAGTEVLKDSERRQVTPVQVDISGLSVAAVGAPLDELREDRQAVNPDISHLKLV